ncbi:PTS sugar transporter subunit IIA [Propionispora vibrioides]|uniref:PTS system, mannose-specific IIA component n=1 Tax=Propionispora vibrioides TaxID=112903 RepID=A0A1H8WDY6_9FIRM|nr:PTS sugar transporter subunit IIA [Propionispora vibrioides]SEP25880.1 PTS system, mannose-specific IIA component [Propionispora vibrioides]
MDSPKFRVVLVSHGEQSQGMLNTVQMLLGPQKNIAAHSLYPEQSVIDLNEKLQEEIEQYGSENIIFMSELIHGSPFNAVVSLTREHHIFHITGINLAMLMTALLMRDREDVTAQDICEATIAAAEGSFADVGKILEESTEEEEEED